MSSASSKRRLRRGSIALAVVAAFTLSACAGSGTSTNPAEPTDSGQEIESVTVGFSASLSNLYPGQEDGINNYWVAGNVMEGLVSLDATGQVAPALATEWKMVDPTTYVFTLRDDAKFQNGDPVTPEDVVFSFQMAQDPELSPGTSYYLGNFTSIEKTGDNEITVQLENPDASALTVLSSAGALFVTQKEFWQKHEGKVGTSDSLLLGSGPYKVAEFSPDSHVTLERVDTWWGELPKAKQVRIDFISDVNTRFLAAQKGDIDIAMDVPLKQQGQWEGLDGRVVSASDLSYVGLTFDHNVEPFADKNVREAIALAADQEAIVSRLLNGNGEVANAIMPPESLNSAYDLDQAHEVLSQIPARGFDLEKAKELMAASSVPNGFKAEITYPNSGPQLGTAAQSIAENVKELGIDLTVREISVEEWLATIGDGEHGLGFMWYFSTTGDPGEINGYLLGKDYNPNNIDDKEAQRLIAAATAETDPVQRIATLVELEKLNEQNVYNAPLWWGKSLTYMSNGIGVHDMTSFAKLGPWATQIFAAE